MLWGLILVIIGVLALLFKGGILTASALSYIWPAILIALGLLLLWGRTLGRKYWSQAGCCCAPEERAKTDR